MTRSLTFEKELALVVKVAGNSEQDLALRIEVLYDVLKAAGIEIQSVQALLPGIEKRP